jgi:hypothetical protein
MARNLRSEIVRFLAYLIGHSPRRMHWNPDGSRGDGTPATVLELEDSIPRPPFRRIGATRISVTSEHERLRASRFGAAAGAINKTGAQGHGRTLTCLLAGEPVAALSYHLQDGAILLVTAIAVLEDDAHSEETELSRVLAGVLLCYLAIAAEKRGLPPRLGFAPPPAETALADRLGFRSTAPPSAYRAAAGRYMQWSPPRKLPG